ncbi:MAG: SH3 domain-containing protein [Thermoflexales bacterium]|nr:SH3 domain-containing protein [Thermoflexales bacterium]
MRWQHAVSLFGASLLIFGCAAPEPTPAPTLRITQPANGSTVALGQSLSLSVEWSGAVMQQVMLTVDGMPVAQAQAQGTRFSFEWTPTRLGSTILFVEGQTAEGMRVRSDIIAVLVVNPPTPAPSPTALPEPTAEPTPTAEPPTPTATPELASLVVTNEFANVRSGPSTAFAQVGQLQRDQRALVTGRSADGRWWRIRLSDDKEGWVFADLVQANAVAQTAPVIALPPTATPAAVALVQPTVALVPLLPAATPTPQLTPTPSLPPCGPDNPFWAAKLNPDAPGYTFCTPVPFEFVPHNDPDILIVRWHIYGDIVNLELHIDPIGLGCGLGSKGERYKVGFKEDNFRINRRHYPAGGYKMGLFATLRDGRVQDWGELHFCGTG